jgi:hypothetical protein
MESMLCKICNEDKLLTEYRAKNKVCRKCNCKKANDKLKESGYYRDYYKKNRHDLLTKQNKLYETKYKLKNGLNRIEKEFMNILL